MTSLRRRLMLGIALAATVTLVCARTAIYFLARSSLFDEFDSATMVKARAISSLVELHEGRLTLEELEEAHVPEFERSKKPEYFQLWLDDGSVLAKSETLHSGELERPNLPLSSRESKFVTLPDGTPGRQLSMPFQVIVEGREVDAPRAIVSVARSTAEPDHMLGRLQFLLASVSATAIAAMIVLTFLIVRKNLRPISVVAAQITEISAKNLSRRLDVSTVPVELSPIALGLNDLLERLESAFEREQSFTADAAHELRTPLAGLASALEVCAKKARAPEAYAIVVQDCLAVVRGMHAMIDNLLMLARADADQIKAALSPVHLNEPLKIAWRRFQQAAVEKSVLVKWDADSNLFVQTDLEKLLHVFYNLFDNTTRYVNSGGSITISAHREADVARVTVTNTGCSLSADQVSHVFDRFWRSDLSRSEVGKHCGLGLSVCQKMIAVLQGSICASSNSSNPRGEFVVEITLPLAESAAETADPLPSTQVKVTPASAPI